MATRTIRITDRDGTVEVTADGIRDAVDFLGLIEFAKTIAISRSGSSSGAGAGIPTTSSDVGPTNESEPPAIRLGGKRSL